MRTHRISKTDVEVKWIWAETRPLGSVRVLHARSHSCFSQHYAGDGFGVLDLAGADAVEYVGK